MRKKRLMIAIACIILVGIAVIVFFSQQGKKPYKDLDAAQIVSAKVLLTPPDKTIEIENIQELVEYLNDVVVYNEDNSYTEYDGQGVVFTLTMVDGTQTDIMAYNPFIVIDSKLFYIFENSRLKLNSHPQGQPRKSTVLFLCRQAERSDHP